MLSCRPCLYHIAEKPLGSNTASDAALGGSSTDIVHTFELLVQPPSTSDAKGANELFEVNGAVFILVEYVEDIICELARFSKWEELLIDLAEFRLVQLTRRTIFEETFVPKIGFALVIELDHMNERLYLYHCCNSFLSTTGIKGDHIEIRNGRTVSVLLEVSELLWRQLALRFAHDQVDGS